MVESKQRKVCFGCKQLQFGFFNDILDACDYTCESENGSMRFLLFCTHGMTAEQVTEKLKNLRCSREEQTK